MDPQIEELKELVRQNIALSQDTNKIVHSMRRSAWMSGVLKVVWIGGLVALSVAAYYYFAPYLAQVLSLYSSAQDAIEQARQFGSQFGGQ